jgi:hypothetical protein
VEPILTPCVGLVPGFPESVRAVLLQGRALEDSHHTREPFLLGLAIEAKDTSEAREAGIRATCGEGIVEGTPKSGSPSIPPLPSSEKVTGLYGVLRNTGQDNIPLAFCLTDRSTIRDE